MYGYTPDSVNFVIFNLWPDYGFSTHPSSIRGSALYAVLYAAAYNFRGLQRMITPGKLWDFCYACFRQHVCGLSDSN